MRPRKVSDRYTAAASACRSVENGAFAKSVRPEDPAGNQMKAGGNITGFGIYVQPSAAMEGLFK